MVSTRASVRSTLEPAAVVTNQRPSTGRFASESWISSRHAAALIIAAAILLRLLVALHPYSGEPVLCGHPMW
jgi:hypothetical protein